MQKRFYIWVVAGHQYISQMYITPSVSYLNLSHAMTMAFIRTYIFSLTLANKLLMLNNE